MRRGLLILGAVLALLAVVAGLPALIRLAADWYWFQSLGFERVFLTGLVAKTVLGVAAGVLAFLVLHLNVRLALRGISADPVLRPIRGGRLVADWNRALRVLAWPVAPVLAVLFGLAASGGWFPVMQALRHVPFDVADPVFGRDVGYYVFVLPAVVGVLGFIVTLTLFGMLIAGGLYLVRGDLLLLRRRLTVEPSAQVHLGVLLALFFALVGLQVLLVDLPSLLYSTTGPLTGASFSDLSMRLPFLRAKGVVALVGAALVMWGAWRARLVRHTVIAVVLYAGVALLGALSTSAVQRLVVVPNELARETPQLERHITATRRAWKLDQVEVRDLPGEAGLTLDDVRANQGTIRNVRLWDRAPLLQTFGQLQEIRTYYDFVSVDDDRYWIDGEYRQVLLSPRELNSASLPTRTFINERLTFTHGMGLTLGPVNQITSEGLPVLFLKDLPPVSSVSLTVTEPRIYFGELSNDWVFVNTQQREFDYPSGEANEFTTYRGGGGVPASSYLRRLVLSAHFGSLKILLSQDITSQSRALYHRRVAERARKALPFLRWDRDPYLVITADGRLKWILDAYTWTDRYPYSASIADGTNYLRNSVKVVIDAYDGTVTPYVADPDDPIVGTYGRVFPGLLLPLDSMPADLRAHIRYPEDVFRAQAQLYATYHMSKPEIFYHREDEWQVPVSGLPGGTRDPFLRHIIMKLPGEEVEEFIFMMPFTPRQKDNLSAWMVARNDGESYGQLVVYRFPRQSLVYGPTQVVNRINQDTEISRQVSLWDQRGSEVIRGNLLVIPIKESLIFVQALYLRAEGGRIPELKRVIVAHQNRVVMEETLEASLTRLFGDAGSVPRASAAQPAQAEPLAGESVADLVRQAADHYEQALVAQRAGDWGRYGEEMRRVGELIQQLQQVTGGRREN